MKKTRSRNIAVAYLVMAAVGMAACAGCTPVGSAELETFMHDLLLNAAAALL